MATKPKWNDDPVKLDKVPTTMFMPTKEYKPYIEISREKYIKLCGKYGSYGFSWYFTETGSIKYFDGKEWHYER